MSRTENLEEKLSAFGNGFYGLYQENKEMCSVVSYPDREPWGDSRYRGNCTGHLVKDLILRFNSKSIFDPAEGGGTVREVVNGINKYLKREIHYEGRDLNQGWDILTSQLPEKQFDLVFYHPASWDIIKYSDNPRDLSNCITGSITSLLKLILVETGIWDDIPQPSFPRTRESSSDPE